MTLLDALQWLAFALSVTGNFLVMHNVARPRFYGMVLFFVSNIDMIAWAYSTHNWGILATQGAFFIMSIYALKTHWRDR